jgi:hypothetical protein
MLKIIGAISIAMLAGSLGLSAPARADVTYAYQLEGDFVLISPSYTYFDSGISLSDLHSYSFPPAEGIIGVAFDGPFGAGYSEISLVNLIDGQPCYNTDACSNPTFAGNAFFTPGTYHDRGTGADLVVSTGVPEPSTWALMMIGLAGLGAAWRVRREKDERAVSAA